MWNQVALAGSATLVGEYRGGGGGGKGSPAPLNKQGQSSRGTRAQETLLPLGQASKDCLRARLHKSLSSLGCDEVNQLCKDQVIEEPWK